MEHENILLPSFLDDDTLTLTEVSEKLLYMKRRNEIIKQYKNLIRTRKDGRQYYIYLERKQYTSTTYEGLIDILYELKYGKEMSSLERLFPEWLVWRRDFTSISGKTLKEYHFLWESMLKNESLVSTPLRELKPKDFVNLFRKWTKDREMTRKRFCNIKSLLNGIYSYAIEEEIVEHNPIKDINCRQFTFKPVKADNKVYSFEERQQLLNYLKTINTIYSLAIQLDFHVVIRIGELLSLRWTDMEGDFLHIQTQYLTVQSMNDDLTFNHREHENADHIKGYSDKGFRYMPLTNESRRILKEIKELNPNGEYILMQDGKQLNHDTFNRYLKRYCEAINIPSRSSHKIRFTVASLLYSKGLSVTALQQLLGHTTSAMTLHYLRPITPITETYEAMEAVLG